MAVDECPKGGLHNWVWYAEEVHKKKLFTIYKCSKCGKVEVDKS